MSNSCVILCLFLSVVTNRVSLEEPSVVTDGLQFTGAGIDMIDQNLIGAVHSQSSSPHQEVDIPSQDPPLPIERWDLPTATPTASYPTQPMQIRPDDSVSDSVIERNGSLVATPLAPPEIAGNPSYPYDDATTLIIRVHNPLYERNNGSLVVSSLLFDELSSVSHLYPDSDLEQPIFSVIPVQTSDTHLNPALQRGVSCDDHAPPSASTRLPVSTDELHECIDEDLLDDIVQSTHLIDHPGPPEHFLNNLEGTIKRIGQDFLPRVTNILRDIQQEEDPCRRCIFSLSRTVARLEAHMERLALCHAATERIVLFSHEDWRMTCFDFHEHSLLKIDL